MSRLVMGYWDCKYCNAKGIEGTSQKCPNCGTTREEGTVFYMKEGHKQYLTEEQSKNKGKGADWICPYCNALNSIISNTCENCGSSKYESEKDYFGDTKKKIEYDNNSYEKHEDESIKESIKETTKEPKVQITDKKEESNIQVYETLNALFSEYTLYIICGLLFIIALIVVGVGIYKNTHKSFTPDTFIWETKIEIEHYETCHEEDWSIPSGGRETSHERRIHHYDHVVDHYRTVTKSREVQDGYDVSYTYSNNGDGTFTEHEHHTPRYKTEYYEEEEPVYRDDPVYRTYYFYDIERWVFKHYEVESGTGKTIAWKDYTLEDDTWREGNRIVNYSVKGMIDDKEVKVYKCNENIFKQLELGGKVNIVTNISGDTIIEIK